MPTGIPRNPKRAAARRAATWQRKKRELAEAEKKAASHRRKASKKEPPPAPLMLQHEAPKSVKPRRLITQTVTLAVTFDKARGAHHLDGADFSFHLPEGSCMTKVLLGDIRPATESEETSYLTQMED